MCIKGKIRDLDLATIVRKAEKSESFRRKAKADPTGCKDTTFTAPFAIPTAYKIAEN